MACRDGTRHRPASRAEPANCAIGGSLGKRVAIGSALLLPPLAGSVTFRRGEGVALVVAPILERALGVASHLISKAGHEVDKLG